MSYCRVKTCKHQDKSVCTFHRLPRNERVCKEWVRRIGNEDLLHKTMKNLQNVRICSCHFTKEDYSAQKSLLPAAVPTRFCENTQPISDEKMEKFFLSPYRLETIAILQPFNISNLKHVTHRLPQMTTTVQNVNDIDQPSPNIEKQSTTVEDHELRVCPVVEDENQTSKQIIHHKRKISKSGSETSDNSTGTIMPKKRYRPSVATKYLTVKKVVEAVREENTTITPEIEKLARALIKERSDRAQLELYLKREVEECDKLRQQLKSKESNVKKSSGIQIFLDENERNVCRKKGGERYSHQEILFATGIYKRSPECYRYMLEYMQLPSETTLKRAFSKYDN